MQREWMWKAVSAGCALAMGIAARQVLRQTWKRTAGGDPPENPAAPEVAWREAILWTAASATAAGVARLIAKRGAAAGWTRIMGELPPA